MKQDNEKMIRYDKQYFHFVGFQEENAKTIPSEIPCKPVVYLDGTASRHNQQNIIFEKIDILLTNDSLALKQ